MSEAIGLIIAAIIAAVVAFLTLIISKEQSVSEFRQQWIDALRKDIAIIVGRLIAIQGSHPPKDDWQGFHRVIVRIRLRLNPDEAREGEEAETRAVLDTLKKLESMFPIVNASAKPQRHELDDLVRTLVNNSQRILKANWDRVREGEDGYQKAKSRAVIAVWVSVATAVIVGIGFGLYRLNMICP
jgi:hypothetical protein